MLRFLVITTIVGIVASQAPGSVPILCQLDAAMLIDGSGSIAADQNPDVGQANWDAVTNFAADLATILTTTSGREVNHLAAILFEDRMDTDIIFNLNRRTPAQMVSDLRTLQFDRRGGTTRMDEGVRLAQTRVFVQDGTNDRFAAADVMIIVTDGRISPGYETDTLNMLQQLKDRGVGVLVVGVTDNVDMAQLSRIASCPVECVFTVGQFSELQTLLNLIRLQACEVIEPPTPGPPTTPSPGPPTTVRPPGTCPPFDPYAVAFSAYSANDGMLTMQQGMIIPFSRTLVNIGGYFNTATYRFTCNCRGIYEFHLTLNYGMGNSYSAAIVQNGIVVSPLAYGDHAMSTTAIVQCAAGQQVWAQIIHTNGGFMPCLYEGNSFYGFTGKFIATY